MYKCDAVARIRDVTLWKVCDKKVVESFDMSMFGRLE